VVITSSAVDDMKLEAGDAVDVIFKASDVIVAKGLSGQISARNIMRGSISDIREGFPLALVTIDTGEDKVSAELTVSSLKDMGLETGDEVDAVIKSSELILAKKL
jgi:molybdopterin-binding protein